MRIKKRRGMAAIIGTLIFVAILMTSVIPMYLTMREADTVYNQRQAEVVRLDQDRQREQIQVIATPIPGTLKIKVEVMNLGNSDVKMVRTWINDEYFTITSPVDGSNGIMIHPFDRVMIKMYTVTPIQYPDATEAVFDIRMTTELGNVFANDEGPIIFYFYGDYGGWGTNNVIVNVLVKSEVNVIVTLNLYYVNGTQRTFITTGAVHVLKGGSEIKPFDITSWPHGDGERYEFIVKSGSTIFDTFSVFTSKDTRLYWISIEIPGASY